MKSSSDQRFRGFFSIFGSFRPDAGVLELEEKEFDLEEMLVDAVQPFVRQMEEKGICFGIQGADGISLFGDFVWCSEAFGNIIKNCVEHTPERGDISIVCRDNPIYTEIVIQDSGRGFDGADLPCLFCICCDYRHNSVGFHPYSADCRSYVSIHRSLFAGNLYSTKKDCRNEHCGLH